MGEHLEIIVHKFLTYAHTTHAKIEGLLCPLLYIRSFAADITWGSMSKYGKYVHDHFKIVTPS